MASRTFAGIFGAGARGNRDRADAAAAALSTYRSARVGVDLDEDADGEEAIRDLLVDLLHLAKSQGMKPGTITAMLTSTQEHFAAERRRSYK